MPNTKSAIRRTRRNQQQALVNRIRKSKYKSTIKQMLIYLDYGESKSKLGIVLFCFPGDEKVYYNDDRTKEMRFKNCHPDSSDKVLQWIKKKLIV